MKKYIFFTNGDETKIIPKDALNRTILRELKAQGFKKHHIEVDAENEKEAADKLHEDSEGNLSALADFSGDMLPVVFLAVIVLIIFYFSQ